VPEEEQHPAWSSAAPASTRLIAARRQRATVFGMTDSAPGRPSILSKTLTALGWTLLVLGTLANVGIVLFAGALIDTLIVAAGGAGSDLTASIIVAASVLWQLAVLTAGLPLVALGRLLAGNDELRQRLLVVERRTAAVRRP
jgi:hypothetical protein